MAKLYTDEDFDYPVVTQLRLLSHDVLTAQQAGQAQQRVPDPAVLAFAVAQGRALLTYNRRHFIRLHRYLHRTAASLFAPGMMTALRSLAEFIRPWLPWRPWTVNWCESSAPTEVLTLNSVCL